MKKILMIIIISFWVIGLNGQKVKRFDFKPDSHGVYSVTPTSDQTKSGENGVRVFWTDQHYINELFYKVIEEVLPVERLKSLHLNSVFIINFSLRGEALNCSFSINSKDLNKITEEELYSLYSKLKKIQIDMTKIKIAEDVPYNFDIKEADHFEIRGSFTPVAYRSKQQLLR